MYYPAHSSIQSCMFMNVLHIIIFSRYFHMNLVKFSFDISYMKIHVATPLSHVFNYFF